ncbi:hypothetical protein [Mycobacterium sp.]|uniref:hypothetical protein n=1 Tax=Mycobacterium sp. TaxID=1785 RepID=UPI003D0BEA7E
MTSSLAAFRKVYGSHPLHLLTMLAGFALFGYVVVTATPSTLWKPEGAWWHSMAVWFLAAFLAHDLVVFPIYALIDRILGTRDSRSLIHGERRVPVRNYVRVPALGSGLLLIIFFPGIIRQGASLYSDDTGLTQEPFVGRWLMLTAIMFGVSALAYGIRSVLLARRTG